MTDEYAREVLARASQKPLSAPELVDACDSSERTICRRLDDLKPLGLITETLEIDPDGHHRSVYETRLETVRIYPDDGQYKIHLQLEEDTTDRFAQMWKDIRDG